MAQRGVIVRRLDAIENLGSVDILCTDKTGTLTSGALHLQEVRSHTGKDRKALLRLAASLGAASSHPISRALATLATSNARLPLSDVRERQGLGVVARTEQGEAAMGRPELLEQMGLAAPPVPRHDGPVAGTPLQREQVGRPQAER
jgi:P-type E1-E2 ATPase